MKIKIGFGVDVHQLVPNRDLIIGGVTIPAPFGALGHSDADVLLHALCDAMLGALNLRDSFKLIKDKGYAIGNIDATVILEQPKLNPHIPAMQKIIADILETDLDNVSLKATTHEKVDSFGNQKAVKAYVVCLLTGV